MAAAVLTPRVRLATVCDRARESRTEAGVYHPRGVRQRIAAPAFPFSRVRLWLFLVLSSPRHMPARVHMVAARRNMVPAP